MLAHRVKFAGIGVRQTGNIPGVLNDGDLHTKADAEIRHLLFPGVLRRKDHALNAPAAKAAGNDDAVQMGQLFAHGILRQCLRIDPLDVHHGVQRVARMAQSFRHGEIGVVKLDVLAHEADGDVLAAVSDFLHHLNPFRQLRLGRFQTQLPADNAGQIGLFQHQRGFVQHGQGDILNDAVRLDVAEHTDLLENGGFQRLIAAQNDDIRLDAHALQFLDRVLGGLGLMLVGATEERHQRHVNEQAVLLPYLQSNLTHRLQEGLGLDIADGAANLGDDHIRVGLPADAVDELFDLIGHVGNNLNRGTQILAPAFLVQHVPVHLSGGQVGELVQVFVDEALVVTQVQIGLRAVLGDVDLAVLVGAHGAGVNVDVGVQLLGGDLQSPRLEKTAKRRRGDALAQTGNHAAGHKDVFRHW